MNVIILTVYRFVQVSGIEEEEYEQKEERQDKEDKEQKSLQRMRIEFYSIANYNLRCSKYL